MPEKGAAMPDPENVTVATTFRLSLRLWNVLRGLAEDQALSGRGRPSNASVIRELIEAEGKRREQTKADA
jgi:hypothetical protein